MSVDGKKMAYAPVTVYDSVSKTVAYTKKKLNLRNGAHNTHKYVSTVRKLKKDAKVTIYGKAGNFFYIKYGSSYGFVLKKDLIYMSISTPRVIVNKVVRKYPTVKVTVHNSNAGLNWTQENRVVTFKLKKKSTKTKRYKDGTTITVRTYYVKPRKEGRANTKVRLRKAAASYYVSSYTNTKDVEGFIRVKTSKMYKGANAALPVRKTLKKYNKVIILGKCTKGWFYIKHGNYKGFVKVSDVVYIKATDNLSMYRYNNKNFNAYLVNSYDDRRIKYSSSNNKVAKVSKQVNLANGKRAQVWAEKNGRITLTAYYEYSKGKTIKRKMKLSVRKVKLEIYSVRSNNVGQTMQVSARIKNVTSPKPVIKFSSSNSSLFSKKSEKGNIGKFAVYGIGSGTITVKYRGLKATKKVTTKPLLIFGSQLRPRKDKGDIKYATQTTKQIKAMHKYFKYSYMSSTRDDHVNIWKMLCRLTTMGDLQKVGLKMIDHFMKGSGSDFSDSRLTRAARNHPNTKYYVNGANKSFKMVIKKYNGNVARLRYTHTVGDTERKRKYPLILNMSDAGVGSMAYNNTIDHLTGLKFAINNVHASQIEVTSYKYDSKTGRYTAKLKYTLYDHFGLDKPDIGRFGIIGGFRSWYILQHDKKWKGKYKPFVTKIVFYETVSGII